MMSKDGFSSSNLNVFFSSYISAERKIKNLYPKRLLNFFENYKYRESVFNTIKKTMDKSLSTDFNIFKIMKKESDENTISDIIADMLNTKGTHGQGVLFLKKFVDIIILSKMTQDKSFYFQDNIDLMKINIFREHTTNDGRRIDILIAIENFFYIGIENKVYAGDQKSQIDDYIDYVKKISNDRYIFLYLTPTGKNPDSHSYNTFNIQKNFYCISYFKDVRNWLETCSLHCESWRYKMLINDFIDSINSYHIEE